MSIRITGREELFGSCHQLRFPIRKRPAMTVTRLGVSSEPIENRRIWRRLLVRQLTMALAGDSTREIETGVNFPGFGGHWVILWSRKAAGNLWWRSL